jgi:hypothetical protein
LFVFRDGPTWFLLLIIAPSKVLVECIHTKSLGAQALRSHLHPGALHIAGHWRGEELAGEPGQRLYSMARLVLVVGHGSRLPMASPHYFRASWCGPGPTGPHIGEPNTNLFMTREFEFGVCFLPLPNMHTFTNKEFERGIYCFLCLTLTSDSITAAQASRPPAYDAFPNGGS